MPLIQAIHDAIAAVLRRRGLDWRTCFTDVRAVPPEGRTIVVECSRGDVLDEIRRELAVTGSSRREPELSFVPLPSPQGDLPELYVASASVVDVRRQAAHGAELLTQLVCGDAVSPLKEEGEWVLVCLDDGYVGWVRSWHLQPRSRQEYASLDQTLRHRVCDNVIAVFEAPDEASQPVSDAVIGTPVRVEVCERRGWRRVTLPDGRRGFARARSLEKRPRSMAGRRLARGGGKTREELAATALKFLGIPYVWGGTTPKGFDCSGLVQRVYRMSGIVIPRDSDLQARFGNVRTAGRPDDLRAGELLFFGRDAAEITHVALSLSKGLFVHARGLVRINALILSDPLFDETLAGSWRLVGVPLED